MTSIREQIAAKIKAEFGAQPVDVKPYGVQPSELRKPLVVVFRSELDWGATELVHSFTVQIMGVQGYADQATEDALDGLLDTVLTALQRLDVVAWKTAKRQVFLEQFQGWEIELTWSSVDVYKQAI